MVMVRLTTAALAAFIALLSLAGCGPVSPAPDAGNGGGSDLCTRYVSCTAKVAPANLAAVTASYATNGSCWSTLTAAQCDDACATGIKQARGSGGSGFAECVQCTGNSDCKVAGETCDTASGTCKAPALCSKQIPACSDAAAASLDLTKQTAAPGLVSNTADGATGFKSSIDSTAGGFQPTQSFVYARFTATGLEKVSLSDVQAAGSMDWDIAFRRFYILLNGGDSGPSCTAAAVLAQGTTYDSVTAEPASLSYATDNFLSDAPSCTFQDDGSGLTTSPATALSNSNASFYAYSTCVAMTGRVFVVKTKEGRVIKLTVSTYYSTEAAQASCDSSGSTGGAPGGTIRLRWAFLN